MFLLLLLLLPASRSLCAGSQQQLSRVGGAPEAKQVMVEIKAKDKGFFRNNTSLSLDSSSQILQELKPQEAGWSQQGCVHSPDTCIPESTDIPTGTSPLPAGSSEPAQLTQRGSQSVALADGLCSLGKILASRLSTSSG